MTVTKGFPVVASLSVTSAWREPTGPAAARGLTTPQTLQRMDQSTPHASSKGGSSPKIHTLTGSLFLSVFCPLPTTCHISGLGRGVGHPQTLPPVLHLDRLTCPVRSGPLGTTLTCRGTSPPSYTELPLDHGSPVVLGPST